MQLMQCRNCSTKERSALALRASAAASESSQRAAAYSAAACAAASKAADAAEQAAASAAAVQVGGEETAQNVDLAGMFKEASQDVSFAYRAILNKDYKELACSSRLWLLALETAADDMVAAAEARAARAAEAAKDAEARAASAAALATAHQDISASQ
eukprot:scaffold21204_cov25-Tisochrysis_lutea.AAC.1